MFQDKYRRDIEAVGPGQDQLDRLMEALNASSEEEKPVKKRIVRTVLIAAALCAALVATALAVSPNLREALAQTLGLFAPYSQEVKGVSVTDQGIEVRVVSALTDGNTIAIYFEAQDLTGDRLDAFTMTNTQAGWPENQVEWKQGMLLPTEQIAYDEETKTALYCTKFVGDGAPAQSLTIPLYGQIFSPGHHSFDQPLPDAVISQTVLRTETLPDGSVVLAPMQNPTSLLDGHLTLSSCGLGDDGRFHIQLSVKTGMVASLYPVVQSREFLSGANHYPMENEARFDRDGMTYYDFSYQGDREDAGDMVIRQLFATVHEEEIRGEWRLNVPLETQRAAAISMEQSGTESAIGPKAIQMFLSPVSCTIECDPKDGKYALGYTLTLFHADGSVTSGVKCDSSYYSGSYATNHWTFPRPVDPETVTAVALGLWYVPMENGVAQPGHWLAQQP